MNNYYRQSRTLLLRSTAIFLAIAGLGAPVHAAFDPYAGAEPEAESSPQSLPDTRVLYAPKFQSGRPLNAPNFVPSPTPLAPTAQPSGYAGPTLYSATPKNDSPVYEPKPAALPFSSVEPMPQNITTPAPAPTPIAAPEPTGAVPATPPTPPVLSAAPGQLPPPPSIPGFVAPAPLISAPTQPAPVTEAKPALAATKPNTTMPTPPAPSAAAPTAKPEGPALAKQTQTILSRIPSKIDAPKAEKPSKMLIDRTNPDIMTTLAQEKPAEFESVGLSIKVSRPGLDTNFELNRAYTALMGGDTETAIETYRNIVSVEPTNQDALFGLAATYHRLGDIDKARPFYGQLLKVNPNHREGLNNFLVLVSDESPQEALAELDRLAERNPTFSPIPAQQAVVLEKLGASKEAEGKMLRALELAPDSLTYRYNLAIMLDRHGDYVGASKLYNSLITAALRGEQVPASLETMQKRLNYLTSTTVTPAAPQNNAQ